MDLALLSKECVNCLEVFHDDDRCIDHGHLNNPIHEHCVKEAVSYKFPCMICQEPMSEIALKDVKIYKDIKNQALEIERESLLLKEKNSKDEPTCWEKTVDSIQAVWKKIKEFFLNIFCCNG